MTEKEFQRHLESVGAGPRTEEEIANAERRYQSRIAESRAELAAASFQARRPKGAASLSRLTGLRESMPGFATNLADLPQVAEEPEEPAEPAEPAEPEKPTLDREILRAPTLDREILRAIGRLFIESKKQHGRARAWTEVEDAIMINLHRLAPGWGTIKDLISLARSLDEYSNPAAPGSGTKEDKTTKYRKVLLMNEDGE